MEIGMKIKGARADANLTQEQVAEALGISRQTLSNWENGRTYPDIVSVIKMSDLYAVSLDHLLKEEKPMAEYLQYLEESTNSVKSRERLMKTVLIATYLGIWAIAMLAFWVLIDKSDAMAYSLVYIWGLLPLTTFVVSLLIGRNDLWGRWKWLSCVGFGLMFMLAEYGTFMLANMIAFGTFRLPSFGMLPVGVIVSLLGMTVGWLIGYMRKKAH